MLLRFGGRLFVAVLFLLVGRRRRIGGADAAVDEPEEAERQRRGHGHGDGRDGVDVGLGLRQHQPQHEDGDARVLDARLDGHGHGVLPRLAEDDAGQGAETVAEPHQTYGRHGDGPLDQVHHVQVGVRAEADRHRHDDQRQRLQRLRQHVGHFRPVAADQQPDLCDEQKKKKETANRLDRAPPREESVVPQIRYRCRWLESFHLRTEELPVESGWNNQGPRRRDAPEGSGRWRYAFKHSFLGDSFASEHRSKSV